MKITEERAVEALQRIERGERLDMILTHDEMMYLNRMLHFRPALYAYDPVRVLKQICKPIAV